MQNVSPLRKALRTAVDSMTIVQPPKIRSMPTIRPIAQGEEPPRIPLQFVQAFVFDIGYSVHTILSLMGPGPIGMNS